MYMNLRHRNIVNTIAITDETLLKEDDFTQFMGTLTLTTYVLEVPRKQHLVSVAL